jgi:hypothetical protein
MSGCNIEKQEQCILLGERIRLFVDIYQSKDNLLVDSCRQNKDSIVIPATIVLSNESIEIYSTEETNIPLLSDTPSITNLTNNSSQLIGYRISFVIDTTQTPLNETGNYLAVFSYDQDSVETFKIICPFKIMNLQSARGSCC